jgi:hypothetical protein
LSWYPCGPLVTLLTCLASGASVTWFVLDHQKNALIALAASHANRLSATALASASIAALTPIDILLLVGFITFFALSVLIEWRSGAFSRLLSAQGAAFACLSGLLIGWLGHSYLGRGYLLSGDTIAHVAMLTSQVRSIVDGQSPYWTNLSYFGLPLAEYYSPTTFWPLIAIDLAVRDPTLSLRILFAATYLLSAAAVFALARQLRFSTIGALITAMAYAGSFAHLHLLLYRGAVPQATSMVFLPLVFLFLRRLLADRHGSAPWNWCGLSLSAAGLAANYTPLAIVACVYLGLFAIGTCVTARPRLSRWGALLGAGVMAAILAAFVLLPAISTQSAVRPLHIGEWVFLEWPTLDYFDHLLVWRSWRTDQEGGAAYLGLTIVGLAGYALWRSIRHLLSRDATPGSLAALGLGVLLVASLFVRGMHVRDIAFTLLFVSLLAGIGAAELLRSGRLGRSGPAILVAAVMLDLGSTAIQPIGRSDKGYVDAAGAYLEQQTPPVRTIEAGVEGDRLSTGGPGILSWYGAEAVGAGHAELATRAWIFGDIVEALVSRELNSSGHLPERTKSLLCLLRIGRVVADDRTRMGLPSSITSAETEGPLGRVVKIDCHYQVIFAPSLTGMAGPKFDATLKYHSDRSTPLLPDFWAFYERFLAVMRLNPATGIAATIPVIGHFVSPDTSLGDVDPTIVVKALIVSSSQVKLNVAVSSPGFLRLSQAAHPALRVYRNGSAVTSYEDPMGFIVVPVVAGENHIEVIPETLPVQRFGNIVSLSGLIGMLVTVLGWTLWGGRSRLLAGFGSAIGKRSTARSAAQRGISSPQG